MRGGTFFGQLQLQACKFGCSVKAYIVSGIFNCKWQYINRLMYSSVFAASAAVTYINFYIFHLIIRIY